MKTNPKNDADVSAIVTRLKAAVIGELVTYKELDALVGRVVRTKDRYIVLRALKQLEADDKIVFLCEAKVGWRRVADVEKIKSGEPMRKGIYRKARKMGRRVTALDDYAALPTGAQREHAALLSIAAITATISHGNSRNRLKQLAPPTPDSKALIQEFARNQLAKKSKQA